MSPFPPAPYPQSGVIPYRLHHGQLEVLLITSRRRQRWIIPKGMVETHLTPAESACKEAYEEAGVRGIVSASSVGSYLYTKLGYQWNVEVFLLQVAAILNRWPEMRSRQRRWLVVQEAAESVEEADLQQLIRALPQYYDAMIGNNTRD